MKLGANMWIAVLDGAKGLVLVNEGTALEPRLVVRQSFSQDNPPTREQGSDRPGRMNDAVGRHKSSMEAPDLHQRAEDEFVSGIVGELEGAAAKGAFDKIVLVAPPVALGTIRKEIGRALQDKIVKEIAADYVKLPVSEIGKAVERALEG
ncbi:MAG: host attachment protein [Hyphomicrobiaceae bacterium]|nr:host attachment protein [Hyphomicrobiaceae bacterium]